MISQHIQQIMEISLILLAAPGVIIIAIFIFLLLRKPSIRRMRVKMVEKNRITHDSIIFTFTLPNSQDKLGLKIGEHIEIEQKIKGELVKRKYTPISGVDRVGSFQLLLKIYRPDERFPEGGKMSSYLQDLPLNTDINITLPYGRFNYLGKSNTKITSFEKKVVTRKFDTFYMVAGGTGITPIYQIIQYACEHEKDEEIPNLILLFANRSEDDILLEKNLKDYAEKHPKLQIHFSVDKSITADWKGLVGFVDEEKVRLSAPKDTSTTLFMSCGPPILSNIVEKIWMSNLKIPYNRIYRF